jgi:hypothetical protein
LDASATIEFTALFAARSTSVSPIVHSAKSLISQVTHALRAINAHVTRCVIPRTENRALTASGFAFPAHVFSPADEAGRISASARGAQ